ncbi:MAG: hypothetical protein ACE5KI_03805 [Dehalococcoidia bacterium]
MVWFKSCPRCRIGDMILEQDEYGYRARCVQCSYAKDIADRHHSASDLQLHLLKELIA